MDLNYKCPVCSTNVKIKISDVGQTIRCTKCNLKINVKKDSEFNEFYIFISRYKSQFLL